MYYVFIKELNKRLGGTRVIGEFDLLENAQIFCNEIISEEPKDFFEFYDLIITKKI